MSRRSFGLGGLALAAALAVAATVAERDGAFAPRVDLGNAPADTLATVPLAGRRVTASVGGVVIETDGAHAVLALPEPFVVALPDADDLADDERPSEGDVVLAVGRLRERGGQRRVDAIAWTRVRGAAGMARGSDSAATARPDVPTVGDAGLSARPDAP